MPLNFGRSCLLGMFATQLSIWTPQNVLNLYEDSTGLRISGSMLWNMGAITFIPSPKGLAVFRPSKLQILLILTCDLFSLEKDNTASHGWLWNPLAMVFLCLFGHIHNTWRFRTREPANLCPSSNPSHSSERHTRPLMHRATRGLLALVFQLCPAFVIVSHLPPCPYVHVSSWSVQPPWNGVSK